jgi:hypothetical protein
MSGRYEKNLIIIKDYNIIMVESQKERNVYSHEVVVKI